MTAKKLSAAELRVGLKHAVDRMQTLRQAAIESRDAFQKHSQFRSLYNVEVRAYSLSLHVLFWNTGGEFGEDFPTDDAE